MEEVIVLHEGTSMSGGRRIGCSRGKGSARCGPRGIGEEVLRERNMLEATGRASCLASLSVGSCLKWRAATSNPNL